MATRRTDSNELDIEQGPSREIPAAGQLPLAERLIETVEGPGALSKADQLAFMEEKLDVEVHESTDPNAEPIPIFYVNGVPQAFIRGKVQAVRRKFVEALARCKPVAYTSKEYTSPHNGMRSIRMVPHRAPRYPFSVVHDPNPKGRDWLRQIINEH